MIIIIGILSLIIFYKIYKGSLIEGQLGSACWTKGMTPNVLHLPTSCDVLDCGCEQDEEYYPCDFNGWHPLHGLDHVQEKKIVPHVSAISYHPI